MVGTVINWFAIAALLALVAGFVLFVYSIRDVDVPADLPEEAGIVAFTGAPGRIEKALDLLAAGTGRVC